MTFMTYVSFHDIPGLENSLTKFYDFPRPGGGHPDYASGQSKLVET